MLPAVGINRKGGSKDSDQRAIRDGRLTVHSDQRTTGFASRLRLVSSQCRTRRIVRTQLNVD